MEAYNLSDACIAQIVRLIQFGILTGTDVSDQLRTFKVVVSSKNELEPSPDFLENFEANLQKMVESVESASSDANSDDSVE